jgi:hypothetical protein
MCYRFRKSEGVIPRDTPITSYVMMHRIICYMYVNIAMQFKSSVKFKHRQLMRDPQFGGAGGAK